LESQDETGADAYAASTDLTDLRNRLAEAVRVRDDLRETVSKAQAQDAVLRERRRSQVAVIQDLSSRLDRLQSEERTLRSQLEGDQSQSKQAASEILKHQDELASLGSSRSQAEADVEHLRTHREQAVALLQQNNEQTRQANKLQQEYSREAYSLEAALASIQADMKRISTTLAEDYGLRPPVAPGGAASDAAPGDSPQMDEISSDGLSTGDTTPDEGTESAEAQSLPPTEQITEFLRDIEPSTNVARDRQQAGRLRRQMRALGTVNLDAIRESSEVAERLGFLQTQRTDIERAAEDLRAVIRKIDVEARERFMATFEAVSVQFLEIFRQLFGGGQTRLTLTDPADPVEGGIEISAQPPGKKLQSLQLLSGGERSLTAVALLFAMLKVRPVPFCIMDEVDAALDEANVTRFCDLVKTFVERTQFIVITHNRGTMEIANRLYGVTMTEPGVSRVLSVELSDDAADPGNGRHPLAGVRPPA
jgi:chromosome segregation protein